jgi:hypothetical protein
MGVEVIVSVQSYIKRDGTYVCAHYRGMPSTQCESYSVTKYEKIAPQMRYLFFCLALFLMLSGNLFVMTIALFPIALLTVDYLESSKQQNNNTEAPQ